jgi:hypothetical protein
MEPTMTFQPGIYYVGDPGFVLPNDDLRMLFAWNRDGTLSAGYKIVEESRKRSNDEVDIYWITPTPHKQGTLYDITRGWMGR